MTDLMTVGGVTRDFVLGDETIHVLKGASLTVREGEILAILGRSGAGKSTLLHIMGFLDRPTAGEVVFEQHRLATISGRRQDRLRNESFGFVFQLHHLLPDLTALENVLLPLHIRWGGPAWWAKGAAATKSARSWLERFGLADRMSHRPSQLSGGERQRVALARALVGDPRIVFCDEPTGSLDTATRESILSTLKSLNRDAGKTLVLVTHDDAVASLAHRTVRIDDGRCAD